MIEHIAIVLIRNYSKTETRMFLFEVHSWSSETNVEKTHDNVVALFKWVGLFKFTWSNGLRPNSRSKS